jgi:hypothetical protein
MEIISSIIKGSVNIKIYKSDIVGLKIFIYSGLNELFMYVTRILRLIIMGIKVANRKNSFLDYSKMFRKC